MLTLMVLQMVVIVTVKEIMVMVVMVVMMVLVVDQSGRMKVRIKGLVKPPLCGVTVV